MASDYEDLLGVVAQTLTADNDARRAAEEQLATLALKPGYLYGLLMVVTHHDFPYPARLAALLALKHAVWDFWDRGRFLPEEKAHLLEAVLPATFAATEKPILNGFADIVSHFFRHDYPDRWEAFPHLILAELNSGDPTRVTVSFLLLYNCFRRYEYNRVAHANIVSRVLAVVGSTALALVQAVVADGNDDASGQCLRYAFKMMQYLTRHVDVHPHLLDPAVFAPWMMACNAAVGKALPEPGEAGEPSGMPTHEDDRHKWVWWRVKKIALVVIDGAINAIGQPQLEDDEDVAVKALSQMLNNHGAPMLAATVVELLEGWATRGRYLPRRVAFYAINILQQCIDFASAWKAVIKAKLPMLLTQMCVRAVRLSDSEAWDLENDVASFMASTQDIEEWSCDPRHAVDMFLAAAIVVRAKDTDAVLEPWLASTLAADAAAPAATRDIRHKEAVMTLLQMLPQWFTMSKRRRRHVITLLTTWITPELRSPHVMLRNRAIVVWYSYVGLVRTMTEPVTEAVSTIYGLLDDPALIVRLTAGSAIERLVSSSQVARNMLRPHVPLVLDKLFSMLGELGLDEVVRSVNIMCEAYYDQLPGIAGVLVARMAALVDQLLAGEGAAGEDGMDDAVAMSGEGALETLRTVISELLDADREDVIESFLPSLWAMLYTLFPETQTAALAFFHGALRIYGDACYSLQEKLGSVDEPWRLYPMLMHAFTSWNVDYTDEVMGSIDYLFSYAPDRFAAVADPATGLDHAAILLNAAATVNSARSEIEMGWMARMVLSVLYRCNHRLVRLLPRVVELYVPVLTRGHTKYLRSQASSIISAVWMIDSAAAFTAMEAAGCTGEVLACMLECAGSGYHRKSNDAKVNMLAFTHLLRLVPGGLPASAMAMVPNMVAAVVSLEVTWERLRVAEAELRRKRREEEEEDDFSVPDFKALDEEEEKEGAVVHIDGDDDDEAEAAGAGTAPTVPGVRRGISDDEDYVSEQDLEHKRALRESDEGKRDVTVRTDGLAEGDEHDDEPVPADSPFDHMNQYLWAAAALAHLQGQTELAAAMATQVSAEVFAAWGNLAGKASRDVERGWTMGAWGPPPDDWVNPDGSPESEDGDDDA